MAALDLSVGLGMVGRGQYVAQPLGLQVLSKDAEGQSRPTVWEHRRSLADRATVHPRLLTGQLNHLGEGAGGRNSPLKPLCAKDAGGEHCNLRVTACPLPSRSLRDKAHRVRRMKGEGASWRITNGRRLVSTPRNPSLSRAETVQ